MILLTDSEIVEYLADQRLIIEPFKRERLGPVSYDITTRPEGVGRNGVWRLVSIETITMPRDLVGMLAPRSKTSKQGIFSSYSPLVDPGYRGHVIFLVYNPALPSYPGHLKNLFQLMFFRIGKVNVAYNERKTSTAMDREGF